MFFFIITLDPFLNIFRATMLLSRLFGEFQLLKSTREYTKLNLDKNVLCDDAIIKGTARS